jgi:hypothetical protein
MAKMTKEKELLRSKNIPVLRGELGAFQKQIASLEISMNARFESHERRFESIDKKFKFMVKKMDSGFERMEMKMHQMMGLMEEQNSRNIAVIDGYNQVNGRMYL